MTKKDVSAWASGSDASNDYSPYGVTTGQTTSVLPSKTLTIRNSNEPHGDYAFEMLKRDVFGAYHEGCLLRKRESGFSRDDLGQSMGKDKTGVSKLLRGPGNWTLRTIADFAEALDMDINFHLSDRRMPGRCFGGAGVVFTSFVGATLEADVVIRNVAPGQRPAALSLTQNPVSKHNVRVVQSGGGGSRSGETK